MKQENKSRQQEQKFDYNSEIAILARAKLNIEINQNKLVIDRTVFSKSLEDKVLSKEAKKDYKHLRNNPARFFEFQSKLMGEMITSRIPAFNVSFKLSKLNK